MLTSKIMTHVAHQMKEIVVKRDKAKTTVLMAATKSGSKDAFEAALAAANSHAIGEVL